MRSQFHYLGQPVRSLQTMLRALSFTYEFLPRLTPDGIFGERTLEAVMLFQRELFPPVTGRVDQATWDAFAAAYRQSIAFQKSSFPFAGYPGPGKTISPGQDSTYLRLLQSMFLTLSKSFTDVEPGPVSGNYDVPTGHNIRWAQRAAGQPESGVLDQACWDTVNRLYRLFVSEPKTQISSPLPTWRP